MATRHDAPTPMRDDFHHTPTTSRRVARIYRSSINYISDAWQTPSSKYPYSPVSTSSPSLSADENPSRPSQWMQMISSLMAAPRFRRYALIYTILFLLGWAGWRLVLSPRLRESSLLDHALDPPSRVETNELFGANSMPSFDDLTLLQHLDPALVPGDLSAESGVKNHKRLIVVGDVHGCKDELVELLDKVSFDKNNGDHLIFAGDIINKGPDSLGVVDLARQLSASCVRGNHEDRVLLLRRQMEAANTLASNDDEENVESLSAKKRSERALARALTDEQSQWLERCPVILNVGAVPDMGQVVVVHGGLVPGVELEKQDPYSVMNMRTIDPDTNAPHSSQKGMNWAKVFNKYQSILYTSLESSSTKDPRSETMTVIYGHDAASSLSIRTYTKGLDTACVKGGKLTALVIEDDGKQSIVQVRCRRDYTKGNKKKKRSSFLSFLGLGAWW